jgi:hypothetical protein
MSRSRDLWEEPEEAWETAVDKKKLNRAVRRERKAEEAAAAGAAAVGAPVEEFDAAERRRRAEASFYGTVSKADQRGRKLGKKHRGEPPSLDFEEAGWTGGADNAGAVRKKSKKAKPAVPTYDTAEELYDAFADIISRVPPTHSSGSSALTTTLASLGDKLATLTKQQWNKRYKGEFGSIKSFLAKRSDLFTIDGDYVTLLPQQQSKPKKAARKLKAASNGNLNTEEDEEEEDEDDEEGNSGDEDADDSPQPRLRERQQREAQTTQAQKSGNGSFALVSTLVLLTAAVIGALVFTGRLEIALPQ